MSTILEYDLFSPAFYASPDETLRLMRLNNPVYWCSHLESWVLTRYHDISFVIRDANFSVDRNGQIGRGGSVAIQDKLDFCNRFFASWMVFSDPPKHTLLRALVSSAFTPQLMSGLHSNIETFALELIQAVKGSGRMELIRDFAVPLPAMVTAQMLNIPMKYIGDLKRWSSSIFMLLGASYASDEVVEATYQNLVECKQYFNNIVAQRHNLPNNALINQLAVTSEQGFHLNEEEIAAVCIMLMAGAYETTTHLIANGLLALLQNQDELCKLQENPNLIDSAVEEMFRYCGPAFSVVRRAKIDTQIATNHIKAGQKVYCILHAGNHDPERFEQPSQLDISRSDNRHLGLGLGIHFCLGAILTRLETKIAISTILKHCKNISLNTTKLNWIPNLAMRGLEDLYLRFS